MGHRDGNRDRGARSREGKVKPLFEWLAPWIRPAASGTISLFNKIRGKPPAVDFRPTNDGVVLHLSNARHETVIIERVEAMPRLLTFSTGKEIQDLVVAIAGSENGLVALSAGEVTELDVIVLDPFKTTNPAQPIKVTVHWRAATRSRFSERRVSKTITVSDVEELRRESERRRPRGVFTSV
jgi:hypothetical protein